MTTTTLAPAAGDRLTVAAFDQRSKTRIREHGATWLARTGVLVPNCLAEKAVLVESETRPGYLKWWPITHVASTAAA